MTRNGRFAGLLLTALALLGVQRVPCLLGAAAQVFRPTLAVAAPCHAAPSAPLPSTPARKDGSSPCAECAGVHALVVAGHGSVELSSGPSLLSVAMLPAAAPPPGAEPRLHPRIRDRAPPDRAGTTSVRLL